MSILKHKLKVAVICANNINNAGMFSVDLAAVNLFSRFEHQFDLFDAQSVPARGSRIMKKLGMSGRVGQRRFGQLRYTYLKSIQQLRSYTHVIYWGDFLNNPVYGNGNFARKDVEAGISKTIPEGYNRWRSLFVPDSLSPKIRIASVGGNFLHNFNSGNREHVNDIFRLLRCVSLIAPRDPGSTKNLSTFLPSDKTKIRQGLDCAFLQIKIEPSRTEDYFCYFFGRSGFTNVAQLVNEVKKNQGLKAVELTDWLSLGIKSPENQFKDMQSLIARSRFVLTDTYHVCVNTLHAGVPVICIGRAVRDQLGTLGDLKKKLLFEMFGAEQFYFECPLGMEEDVFFDMVSEFFAVRRDVFSDEFSHVFMDIAQLRKQFSLQIQDFLSSC